VFCCVLKLYTFISTLRSAVLIVLWIEFCPTGLISLCVDVFVFICVFFVCFCFILHSCCIIVSVVGWTWWDRSLILKPVPSVLWHCWLDHLNRKKPVPDMMYNVFGGTLNLALSIYLTCYICDICMYVTGWYNDIWKYFTRYRQLERVLVVLLEIRSG